MGIAISERAGHPAATHDLRTTSTGRGTVVNPVDLTSNRPEDGSRRRRLSMLALPLGFTILFGSTLSILLGIWTALGVALFFLLFCAAMVHTRVLEEEDQIWHAKFEGGEARALSDR